MFGSTSSSPSASSLGTGSSWNFGSTLDANFWGGASGSSSLFSTGLSHIGAGLGELSQSGIFGAGTGSSSLGTDLSSGGFKPLSSGTSAGPSSSGGTDLSSGGFKPVGSGTSMGTGSPGGTDMSAGGFKPVGEGLPKLGQGTGGMDLSLGGFKPLSSGTNTGTVNGGTANNGGAQNDPLAALRAMLKDYMPGANTGAPAPAPAPVNNTANLVNRATQDGRLTGPVTQIANDPVGNKLLNGALDAGLRGIEVANLPDGYFGQFLPGTRQIQIAPMTLGSQDLIRTIAHELVHAATVGNGNSLNEEGLADRLGREIQQRVAGLAPGYVLGGNAYNGLPQDNGITAALRLLGVNV